METPENMNWVMSPSGLLLFISGASRGFGRAVAQAFAASSFPSDKTLRMVLMARSMETLEETRREIEESRSKNGSHLQIKVHSLDCSNLDTLDQRIDDILQDCVVEANRDSISLREQEPMAVGKVIFINNHGSVGHIGPCLDSPSLKDLRQSIDLNVTSALWMSIRIGRFAQQVLQAPCTIVNVSSLVAVQAFPSLGVYSSGKAARDMYHRAMALEHEATDSAEGSGPIAPLPPLLLLNYAPGPLETDMTEEIRAASCLHTSLRPHYRKRLVDPADSACVLVRLLVEESFESGSHVDYFDCLENSR